MEDELIIAKRSDIVAIADAIRDKNGTTEQMSLSEIADMIANGTLIATSLPNAEEASF